jgi:hypothetical protein
VLVPHDGRIDVAIAGFTSRFHLLRGDGTEETGGQNQQGQFFDNRFGTKHDPNIVTQDALATVSNYAVADVDGNGTPDLVSGTTDLRLLNATLHPGQKIDVQHLLSAWTTSNGTPLVAFPRLLGDWTFLTGPVVADVDGDGKPEVIAGDGNGNVFAFHADGTQPDGWPKRVSGWVLGAPAAGDFDGDGHTDVAIVTRQGFLFVFSTPGDAGVQPWPNLRGDPANTGSGSG